MYAETTQSIRDVNENFRNADRSPLRGKAISYVNSMSFDENRLRRKGILLTYTLERRSRKKLLMH